jgi:photosystem II stability/assembly factor-like uncharacterized protein
MSNKKSLCTVGLVLIGFCSLCRAQAISITGTVVDNTTSQGIGGATVKLLEFPSITATTAANGTFTIAGTSVLAGHAARRQTRVSIVKFGNLRDASGKCAVVLHHNGSRYLMNGALLDGNQDRHADVQSDKQAIFAKSSATYTLRVTAGGYIMKDTVLASTTASAGTIRLTAESEQTGVWTNVTPAEIANDGSGFGAGSIAGDPLRPGDMYVGGSKSGIWKTTDYGKTWTKINNLSPDITRGCIIAVAGTTPATVYVAGFGRIFKSTNAGVTFDTLSTGGFDPYSFAIDPYDPAHLLSGLHEAADVIESTNGGATWHKVGSGSIGGGVSVYPFFIDMGNAAATRTTWFAIGQNGCSPGRTTNGGATWTMPQGLDNLQHPHGNARIFQQGPNLWVGGAYDFRGTILRSTDYGVTFTKVTTDEKPEALVWGTEKNVYAMYAWACSRCDVQPNFGLAPLPGGTNWTYEATPGLKIGPNSIAVANNGSHYVFVGLMWAEGLWRYVEP